MDSGLRLVTHILLTVYMINFVEIIIVIYDINAIPTIF